MTTSLGCNPAGEARKVRFINTLWNIAGAKTAMVALISRCYAMNVQVLLWEVRYVLVWVAKPFTVCWIVYVRISDIFHIEYSNHTAASGIVCLYTGNCSFLIHLCYINKICIILMKGFSHFYCWWTSKVSSYLFQNLYR